MEQRLRSLDGAGNSGMHISYRFDERSYLNLIKRDVGKKALEIGLSPEQVGKLDIIISELVTNLLKFGERGREFLWKQIVQNGKKGIELIAIDKGPGISHVLQAMQDGYSTAGTAGEGLGAVKRLSNFFDIYSQTNAGTAVLCRVFEKEGSVREYGPWVVGGISVAKSGESDCGDGYLLECDPSRRLFRILVLDGLGHGTDAHRAAEEGINVYRRYGQESPSLILKEIHSALTKTRGAVGMALSFDVNRDMLIYSGVGNISGRLTAFQKPVSLVSSNGILGYTISTVREHETAWGRGQLLVVHSDGIPARWDLSAYPGIERHDPVLLAACLYRDFDRTTDDVTVIVSRYPHL